MSEEGKSIGVVSDHDLHPPLYGTFQGVANYPPPQPPSSSQPVVGYPQPVPPPGVPVPSAPPPFPHQHYAHGYQAVPGYAVTEGRPVRELRLPCCGIGSAWVLFILGFFLAGIPWYAGALILLCASVDYRNKPGYIACTVAAILLTIAIMFEVTQEDDHHR